MKDKLLKLQEDYGHISLFSISDEKIVESLEDLANYFFTEEVSEVCVAIEAKDIDNLIEEVADLQITCEFMMERYKLPESVKHNITPIGDSLTMELLDVIKVSMKTLRGIENLEEIGSMLSKAYTIYFKILEDYKLDMVKIREWYEAKRRRIIYNYENNKLY